MNMKHLYSVGMLAVGLTCVGANAQATDLTQSDPPSALQLMAQGGTGTTGGGMGSGSTGSGPATGQTDPGMPSGNKDIGKGTGNTDHGKGRQGGGTGMGTDMLQSQVPISYTSIGS